MTPFYDGMHFNEAGSERVAQLLFDYLTPRADSCGPGETVEPCAPRAWHSQAASWIGISGWESSCRPKVQMSGFLPSRNVRFFPLMAVFIAGGRGSEAASARRIGCAGHGRVSADDRGATRRGVPARSSRASRRVVAGFATFASVRSRCCAMMKSSAAESRLLSTTSPCRMP